LGTISMRALFLSQVVEQLAHTGVLCARSRLFIEAPTLHFHGAGLVPHGIETQRLHQPDWPSVNESPYVLPPDERNVLAEFPLVDLDQSAPVSRFFRAHAVKHRRRCWKILAQTLSVIGVDALVFFFKRDCESQDLPL